MDLLKFSPALLLLLVGCGEAPPGTKGGDEEQRLVIGGPDASERTATLYQMPTPNELFTLVRVMAGEGQKRMLNPASSADRYVTLSRRALNFGVYATDLVYASYFDLNVEVVRYYLTVKKLGEQLGLQAAFSERDFVRLESNLARGDSLEVISNEAYFRAYQKLQDEEMGPTLALVLAGGWVESMHLVMRQIDHFDPEDPLVRRVAEQKTSLDHLVEMMAQYKDDPEVGPVRQDLIALRAIYDQLAVRRVPATSPSASGRMVLGEDLFVDMTADKYVELENAVQALRERIVTPEDREQQYLP
ncbi:MAG: hypothetical protein KDC03_04135 [Flavobacteriales bacterium]|nr:hypothetical protein [Flavobacteriales bacterium]